LIISSAWSERKFLEELKGDRNVEKNEKNNTREDHQ
jgi:hypothetical protein